MSKRIKWMIVSILFFGVVGALIYSSIGNAATFYMTVDELKAEQGQIAGKPIKLSGKIVGDSIEFDSDKILLTFELRGEENKEFRVPIQYEGAKPDTLNDGWEAIVTGKLSPNGKLVATELLVKCPSKYEAMDEEGEELPADQYNEQQEGGY
ncbi:cytochrome c maturation protein CcmE [Aquibacillus sp. 3ASR75-11]|uniref:Cytochrome c maturation protein CcmE n=1 Tax=Terrihalobacillus insolitus TaxID=2950438 RepID=A0A9X3WU04_9BACI|nr:cytochrome c maturation protein CcmE [Terrihalobacillus insolitus]MDC3414546.1 cytochrome c maturation protein CcmE [Terrihalobacillus insolitus]MDC3425777.1 cytochrome c maturation protein CcmE [Terrihalobacillus insolitus]